MSVVMLPDEFQMKRWPLCAALKFRRVYKWKGPTSLQRLQIKRACKEVGPFHLYTRLNLRAAQSGHLFIW